MRAEHAARRLLRRTRSLARQASRRRPLEPAGAPLGVDDTHITLVLPAPAPPEPRGEREPRLEPRPEQPDEVARLRARLERSEHAAAWLRTRLRAERMRGATTPALDAAALADDLTRDLARLRAHDAESIGRVVRRVLAAHRLPVQPPWTQTRTGRRTAGAAGETAPGAGPATIAGWSREQQEAMAALALARAPEIASPLYVDRALTMVAVHGGGTLARLTRESGFDSAMGKRRLRLAIDALAALGALVARDGVYTLNTEYRPPHQPRGPHGPGHSARR